MNKQTQIVIIISVLFFIVILALINKTPNLATIASNSNNQNNIQSNNNPSNQTQSNKQINISNADKIIVVHFHATQQCWSCVELGNLAKKTIEENFSNELAKGIIEFKAVNVELPENRDIVIKYQARGSSLFVNVIKDGQDHIYEDTRVWMLINNEQSFKEYFEKEIINLL